jgi:hypothetical protein
VTQGSMHFWNLEKMTWVRFNADGLNPMWKDNRVLPIHRIERWPEVGSVFMVWAAEHEQSMHVNWHQSSTIRRIVKFNGDDLASWSQEEFAE